MNISHENILRKNKKIQNLYPNETLHILGNGPSLGKVDLKKIANGFSVCVNEFYLIEKLNTFNPNFIVLADPLYYEEPDKYSQPLLDHLGLNISKTTLLAPIEFIEIMRKNERLYKKVDNYYYDFDNSKEYSFDISKKIKPIAQNVLNICIILGVFCGFKNIYLHGIDHDILSMSKEMFENDWNWPHAYSEKKENNIGLKTSLQKYGIGWPGLKDIQLRMINQYSILKEICTANNVKILN